MEQCNELFAANILLKLPQYEKELKTQKKTMVDPKVYGNHNLRMLNSSKMADKIPLKFLDPTKQITHEIFDQTLIHKTSKEMKTITDTMVEITHTKDKLKIEIDKISKNKIVSNQNIVYSYSKGKIIEMLNKLPIEYSQDFDLWTIIGNALKSQNLYKIFDHSSKRCPEKYDTIKNKEKYWEIWIPKINIDFLNVIMYENGLKPVIKKSEKISFLQKKPDKKVNLKHIEIEDLQGLSNYKALALHCSTGSGKSKHTSVLIDKMLKEDDKCKVLMIESRISMGSSHLNDFMKYTKKSIDLHDQISDNIELNDSRCLSICFDSLQRLMLNSWKNCVLYLDELASTLPYIINSDTLKEHNKRASCFMMLLHLIKECKFVYVCDADLNDSCLVLLEKLGVNYYLYQNEHKTYQGINAYEFTQEQKLIDKLKIELVKNDKPKIVAFDCLEKLELFYTEICMFCDDNNMSYIKDGIKKYTSKEYNRREMEEIEKTWSEARLILFSPKITVGISFTHDGIKYDSYVFSYGSSINSSGVYQQLSRNRNIDNLYYYVANKVCKRKFYSVGQVREYYVDILKCYGNLKINHKTETTEKKEIMNKYEINYDDFKKSISSLENIVLLDIEKNYKFSNDVFETIFYYNEYYEDVLRSDHKYQFELILIRKGFNMIYENDEYYQQLEKSVENPEIINIKNEIKRDTHKNNDVEDSDKDESDGDESGNDEEPKKQKGENEANNHKITLDNDEKRTIKINKIDKKELKTESRTSEQKIFEKIINTDAELVDDKDKTTFTRIVAVTQYLKLNMNDKELMKETMDLILYDKNIIRYKNFLSLICTEEVIHKKFNKKNEFIIKKLKSNDSLILVTKKLERILNIETLDIDSSNENITKKFSETIKIDDDFLKLFKFESETKNNEFDTNRKYDFWYFALINCYKKILPNDIIKMNTKRFKIDIMDTESCIIKRKNYYDYKTDSDAIKKYLKIHNESNMNYANVDKKFLERYDIKVECVM